MLKVLSLFSGIGAFEKALDNLEVDYELINFCEFDKYAVKSYCAIHNVDESKNLGDITKVDETKLPKDIDVLTYGFPCQPFSIAGNCEGFDDSKGRGNLFFDALRIIGSTEPKVAIAENVKNLTGKRFKREFETVLQCLSMVGYNNHWMILNSKDFGVPQNRERVFIVSIRKDIDTGKFEFPEGFELKKRLKDVLEDVVDEKYYLSEKMFNYVFNIEKEARGIGFSDGVDRSYINPDVAQTIGCRSAAHQRSGTTNYVADGVTEPILVADMKKDIVLKQIGQMYPNSGNPQAGRIYDADGISPTMDTCSGGNRMPKVAVGLRGWLDDQGKWQQQVEVSDREYANTITTVQKDSLVGEPMAYDEQNRYIRKDGCVGTSMTDGSSPKKNNRVIQEDLRIRKLTPKECFRLMGFDDESFHRAEVVNSNTQLYKQAGNSIVVDVLEELFCMMLDEDGNLYV